MTARKILFSNLGYARGIGGSLPHHLMYLHRHFYCAPGTQRAALAQLAAIIAGHDPDLCCLVEIDQGSFTSGGYNQMLALASGRYPCRDIEIKYAPGSRWRRLFLTQGKSNAFLSKRPLPFETIYLSHGAKRLVYKIALDERVTVFFAHFSLLKSVREKQLREIRRLTETAAGEIVILGDFNIFSGVEELAPLMDGSNLVLLNKKEDPTFRFHRFRLVLDLCICSQGIARRAHMKIVPQPFSDHSALIVELGGV